MSKIHLWGVEELDFYSQENYENPYIDVKMHVVFYGPDGTEIKIPAFWDGNNIWKVRFAPIKTGVWRWKSYSNYTNDRGLHGREGEIEVYDYIGDNNIYKHGFLKVSKNRRYFTRADDTPFLWVGDTCWAAVLKASDDEWVHYVKDRAAKGFNLLQTVVFFWSGWFEVNNGPVFENNDFDRKPNMEFFRSMDRKFKIANQYGLTIGLVFLWHIATPWAWMDRPSDTCKPLEVEQAVRFAKYLVARYCAYDVVWIMTGDGVGKAWWLSECWLNPKTYNVLPLGIPYNQEMGKAVINTDPYRHPSGTHPHGYNCTGEYFQDEEWIDYNMYQTNHAPEDDPTHSLHYFLALQGYRWKYRRPVVDAEPCYESQGDEVSGPFGVRRSFFWSILSGACGYTYGAWSIFKWWRGKVEEGDPEWWAKREQPNTTWKDQLDLKGACHLYNCISFLNNIPWWDLKPSEELVKEQDKDPLKYIAAASSENMAVLYAPDNKKIVVDTKQFMSSTGESPCEYKCTWYIPESNEYLNAEYSMHNQWAVFDVPKEKGVDFVLILKVLERKS